MKKRGKRALVDEEFHKVLKMEAAKRGMSVKEFSQKLAFNRDEFNSIFKNDKKKRKIDLGI